MWFQFSIYGNVISGVHELLVIYIDLEVVYIFIIVIADLSKLRCNHIHYKCHTVHLLSAVLILLAEHYIRIFIPCI